MLKKITNKRAETILEVTIALFIIGVGITVSSMVLNRIMNVTAQNKLFLQGTFFAREGLEGVRNLRDTNVLRYADTGCWKTVETADTCASTGPSISPMMATATSGVQYYSTFFDHLDFTWSLVQTTANIADFTDSAILSRLPNVYSIHEKFLGNNESKPIYINNVTGADNTFFYRRITVRSLALFDTDADPLTPNEDVLIVTSEVKWPYRNKVLTYSSTIQLTRP